MQSAIHLLLTFVATTYASHAIHSFDECYREGDLVLDPYNRCKYRKCERVEPEDGYGHFKLVDKECAEGSGVPYFLIQQYMHGVYAGRRFIGRHLGSIICHDKYVKNCQSNYGYGYGRRQDRGYGYGQDYRQPQAYGYGHRGYPRYPDTKDVAAGYPTKEQDKEEEEEKDGEE